MNDCIELSNVTELKLKSATDFAYYYYLSCVIIMCRWRVIQLPAALVGLDSQLLWAWSRSIPSGKVRLGFGRWIR